MPPILFLELRHYCRQQISWLNLKTCSTRETFRQQFYEIILLLPRNRGHEPSIAENVQSLEQTNNKIRHCLKKIPLTLCTHLSSRGSLMKSVSSSMISQIIYVLISGSEGKWRYRKIITVNYLLMNNLVFWDIHKSQWFEWKKEWRSIISHKLSSISGH